MKQPCVFNFSFGIFLIWLLSGCSVQSFIHLKKDGAAEVITAHAHSCPDTGRDPWPYTVKYQKQFFKHSQISELSFADDSIRTKFRIQKIDSLNNFLYSGFNRDFFRFAYKNDTLTVTDGNGEALICEKDWQCCTFTTSITSERKIKSFHSNNSCAKLKGNTVIIQKTRRQYIRGKKKLKITLVLEG